MGGAWDARPCWWFGSRLSSPRSVSRLQNARGTALRLGVPGATHLVGLVPGSAVLEHLVGSPTGLDVLFLEIQRLWKRGESWPLLPRMLSGGIVGVVGFLEHRAKREVTGVMVAVMTRQAKAAGHIKNEYRPRSPVRNPDWSMSRGLKAEDDAFRRRIRYVRVEGRVQGGAAGEYGSRSVSFPADR